MARTRMVTERRSTELELADLRERVAWLETVLFRTVVSISAVTMALGFFLPFLVPTREKDEDESLSLVSAAFNLGKAGGGPFRGEAMITAVVVGGFALLALVTLVVVATLLRATVGARALAVARGLCIALLVGCGLAWLLVLALAGHFDGRVSRFSPALAALTVGAVFGILLRHVRPAHLRDEV